MSKLMRLAEEAKALLTAEDLLHVQAEGVDLNDYEVELDQDVSLDRLDTVLDEFKGRRLTSNDDADMAISIHNALPLTAREASDKTIWWWLCLRRYPDLVRARWLSTRQGQTSITATRMFGDIKRNALARLWWGAEMVSTLDDAEERTRELFGNQDLFEAVIGRRLGRYPLALQSILTHLAREPGKPAREAVRDLGLVLSTVVLEGLPKELIAEEVSRRYEHLRGAASSA